MKIKLCTIFIFFIFFSSSFGQSVRQQKVADTSLVSQLNSEGDKFYNEKNYTKALAYYQKALEKAHIIKFRKGMMQSHSNMASTYRFLNNNEKSVENHQKTIKYALLEKDETQLAKSYINLGNVYRSTAEYKEALNAYLKGLEYSEKIKNTRFRAIALNNIGEIYRLMEQNQEALSYYEKSLQLGREINNESQIATAFANIGSIYTKLKQFDKALATISEAEKIAEKLDNKRLLLINYINKGNIFIEQKKYLQAIDYMEKALPISREIKDNYNEAIILANMGRLYYRQKDLPQTKTYFYESLNLAEKNDFKLLASHIYYDLILFYSQNPSLPDSVSLYTEKYRNIKEQISNEKNAEEIARLQNAYEFKQKQKENELLKKENRLKELEVIEIQLVNDKNLKDKEILSTKNQFLEAQNQLQKADIEKQKLIENEIRLKAEQEKKAKELLQKEALIQEQTIRNQRNISLVLGIIALLIACLALVLVIGYRQRQKANKILQFKNQEINQQKEEILAQRDLLDEQNKLLEFEKKNTLDSIKYAQNIQKALLPFNSHFQKNFEDYFILYEPKDIVSGDFYYFTQKKNQIYLAVADCTGHGVPGAFMSNLGVASMENIIEGKKITCPAQILYTLDATIREALHQHETGNQDGMDIALCMIDKENQVVEFAGANNGIFVITDGNFTELSADKNGIGGILVEREKKFTKHTLSYQNEMQLYLFSDGFQDQFGGEKDKKFSRRRFKETLQQTASMLPNQRLQYIKKILNDWKGNNQQTDDITLIGITLYGNSKT